MGEISDALARARDKADTAREEALVKRAADNAARKPTRAPSPSPSAAGLITPRPDENAASDRSTPLSLDQLRDEQKRGSTHRDTGDETSRSAQHDLAGSSEAEPRTRRRAVHRIPQLPDEGWLSRLCAVYPESPAAVRFRHLAVRVRAMLDEFPRKSVLVTSAVAGEGKTTVSVNLALALASIAPECRIALVDLDLRRGRIGIVFEHNTHVGIEHVLSGEVELEDACVETDIPGLDFYPIATTIPDAHRLLGGAAARVLRELQARYDYLICDGPPVLPVPDIPLLAPQLGGCLAVVASGRSKHAQFREMLELVPRKSMLGVFLNESPAAAGDGKYKYYDPILPEKRAKGQPGIAAGKAASESADRAAARAENSSQKAGAERA